MTAHVTYFDRTMALLEELRRSQMGAIDAAAELFAERISRGGLVLLFGAGHSRMMCEEMTPRQGCFPGFVAMVEHSLSNHAAIVGSNGLRTALHLEKYEGLAEEMLKSYAFGRDDVLMVISTSGIRPVIVEMALGAKARGLPVVALISVEHCRAASSGHASGKKLIDVADIVLDNRCPPGDCVVEIEGLECKTGPASTVTGAMLINMVRCETAERLVRRGSAPVVLPSHQSVGDTAVEGQLERFYDSYRRSLAHLFQ
ncbi:MAG: sugar isomerase domain-containing protein [Luteitalea sp.]|nr:sugar isomerase domain-containing protein [Luteitalea sp.]